MQFAFDRNVHDGFQIRTGKILCLCSHLLGIDRFNRLAFDKDLHDLFAGCLIGWRNKNHTIETTWTIKVNEFMEALDVSLELAGQNSGQSK